LGRERDEGRNLAVPELLGAEVLHVLRRELTGRAVGVELELRSLPLVHDLGGHPASIAVRRALVDLLRELVEFFIAFRIHVLCGRLAGDKADHQDDEGEPWRGSNDPDLRHRITSWNPTRALMATESGSRTVQRSCPHGAPRRTSGPA